jgi:hypothetical protein
MERFNPQKLSEVDFKEHCQLKIWTKFAALEDLNGSTGINMAWEHIMGNVNSLSYGFKQNKPKFD